MTKEQSEITPKTTPPPSGNGNNGNEWAANAIQFQRNRLVGEVADANLLLEFGLANGKPIPDDLIAELAVQPANGNGKRGPDPPDGFQTAYRDLVQFLAPVTAASLRATDDQHGRNVRLWAPGQRSAGKLWSRKLWLWTIAFAVFVVFSENYQGLLDRFYALADDSDAGTIRLHMLAAILGSIVPFAYGGVGSGHLLDEVGAPEAARPHFRHIADPRILQPDAPGHRIGGSCEAVRRSGGTSRRRRRAQFVSAGLCGGLQLRLPVFGD